MSDESKRQDMVMMGPGFGAGIGEAIVTLIWLAIAGWVLLVVGGVCWWIFG